MSESVIKNGVLEKYKGPGGDVVVPEGVTSIGYEAFSGCTSLTSIILPEGVTSIDDRTFLGCKSLTSITLSEKVTTIGSNAFYGCTNLTSITLPENLTSIGYGAFVDCTSLTSIILPASLTSIGSAAFWGCTDLQSIIVSKENQTYTSQDGMVFSKDLKIIILCPQGKTGSITLPHGVTSIRGLTFEDCTNLTSITLPQSLTSIGNAAFKGCENLRSITLPAERNFEWLVSLPGSETLAVHTGILAYICQNADETQMAAFISRTGKWPSLWKKSFYAVYLHSDTRAAMLLAEKRKEFDQYAAMRGMDPDELRDRYLSDLGLDAQRGKRYDLGNQTVTARMQKDLSFRVELPDGKMAASLPKKGADQKKFEAAKADFSQLKKDAKSIWKNRADTLLGDFITGRERSAEYWTSTYGGNPILHAVACLIVWKQKGTTFIRTDAGLENADGHPYTLTDAPIRVAHPMELKPDEIDAWQHYFTSRGLKQPFAQIWEPVHTAADIRPDRYKGCPINFFQLNGAVKHGFDEHLIIPGCEVKANWSSETAANGNSVSFCDIQSFIVKKYSRRVNHAVAYLDRITILGRVRKDDTSVMDWISGVTLAQITEFIAAAQEANAVNVLALLLEYKNARFADFDPMAEFTLEW